MKKINKLYIDADAGPGDAKPEPAPNERRNGTLLLAARQVNEKNKEVIFENFNPFTKCISEISNTLVDDAKYLDVVMPMHNLIELRNNY